MAVMTRCLILAGFVFPALSTSALAWNGASHEHLAWEAFDHIRGTPFGDHLKNCNGQCPEIRNMPGNAVVKGTADAPGLMATAARYTDNWHDLEFVDVDGGMLWDATDDPHEEETWAEDDHPRTSYEGEIFTAFNHFIDIKKGSGIFDDYDGYAYEKGSPSRDEYQDASEMTTDWFAGVIAEIAGFQVDEGLMWWFNDEYVHAPGHKWYRRCSPALERYSFPKGKGKYKTMREECAARFPRAQSTGEEGLGLPYSVFMPVDNLARYWYGRFVKTKDPQCLGAVLHAIGDASIPHHAAGYLGNWHRRYETELESRIVPTAGGWAYDEGFWREAILMSLSWCSNDPSPPTKLSVGDWSKKPAINWKVDQLVTWMALNAYREYAGTYNHFSKGYKFDENSARNLTKQACALTLLVLFKAARDTGLQTAPSEVRVTAPPAPEGPVESIAVPREPGRPGATRVPTLLQVPEGSVQIIPVTDKTLENDRVKVKEPPKKKTERWSENFDGGSLAGWLVIGDAKVTTEGDQRMLVTNGWALGGWQNPGEMKDFALRLRYRHADGIGDVVLRGKPTDPIEYMYHVLLSNDRIAWVREMRQQPRELVSAANKLKPGQWYELAIKLTGGKIQVAIDGKAVLTAEDTDPLASGLVGFGSLAGNGFAYDDISLTANGAP